MLFRWGRVSVSSKQGDVTLSWPAFPVRGRIGRKRPAQVADRDRRRMTAKLENTLRSTVQQDFSPKVGWCPAIRGARRSTVHFRQKHSLRYLQDLSLCQTGSSDRMTAKNRVNTALLMVRLNAEMEGPTDFSR